MAGRLWLALAVTTLTQKCLQSLPCARRDNSDTESSVPADFALRSPFPTMLILRGTDVREAEDLCDIQGRVTEDIAIANEARLRSIGFQKLRDVFAAIFNSARGGDAVGELADIQAQRLRLTSDMTRGWHVVLRHGHRSSVRQLCGLYVGSSQRGDGDGSRPATHRSGAWRSHRT